MKGELEAGRLDLGKGDDLDGLLDIGEGSVTDCLPIRSQRTGTETPLQILHDLMRCGSLGPRTQQRVDELLEWVPRDASFGLPVMT